MRNGHGRRLGCALGIALLATTAGSALAVDQRASVDGSWVGTYRLGGPGKILVQVAGSRATVVLGVGQADLQVVPASVSGERIRLTLPGRPPLRIDARVRGGSLTGTIAQGSVRGTLSAKRGTAPDLVARGVYRGAGGREAVVDDPYGPARLLDLASGRVRAVTPRGAAFSVGSGFATPSPATGTATFTATGARIGGRTLPRLRHRQLEVRFASSGATLSGTLTLPTGTGRHAAVAFVAGSGSTQRAYLPDLTALLVDRGVAVLAYDKRGVGQSSGSYPGESPTASTIDVLARDAQAAARFLAAQPEVDATRVGLAGHSQAGWVMPLAATRERTISFLVAFSAPTVTADEVDLFQDLTGQGDRIAATLDEAERRTLERGPGGVNPVPWLRSLTIPSLWLYGELDQHIPARLSAAVLEKLPNPGDRTVVVFPRANHALVQTQTGLTSEMLRSDTFASGLFATVGEWLTKQGLGRG